MKLQRLIQKCRAGHRARQNQSARWPTLRWHKTEVFFSIKLAVFLASGGARMKQQL
jgi:hypothetical protein